MTLVKFLCYKGMPRGSRPMNVKTVTVRTDAAQQLVDIHDLVTSMNTGTVVKADVGVGLWIMVASAAGALIASFRIAAPEEIG